MEYGARATGAILGPSGLPLAGHYRHQLRICPACQHQVWERINEPHEGDIDAAVRARMFEQSKLPEGFPLQPPKPLIRRDNP